MSTSSSSSSSASSATAPSGSMAAGIAMALLGSIAFSGKAIIVKLAYRYGVDPVTLLMYRMLFALPVFLLMGWWAGRGKPGLGLRDWLGVAWLGFTGYYLASYLDFAGLHYISASLERLILYLNPTLVLLLGMLMYKKRPQPAQWVAMGVSYAGVLLVFGHEMRFDGWGTAIGAGLVLGSAVSYAVYLVYSGELVKRLGSLRLAGLASSAACVFCILQFVVTQPLSAAVVAPEVIGLSVLNATACTVIPVLLVMMAIERIGPGLAAQVGMIGPMSTILMGIWLLDEPFNAWIVAGTALVMGGVYIVTRRKS
ncbi:DMT family transporter [Comamonadaceae bacterium PP-2]